MRRIWRCGIVALWLALVSSNPAWPYTLQLQYFSDSHQADAYARKTGPSGALEVIPGEVTGQGAVSQAATTGESPAVAKGGGSVSQAVLSNGLLDCSQRIINTFAAAGNTDNATYEGYGQGYGYSIFGFKIVSGPGEPSRVWVTIGYRVNGAISLERAASFNKLILEFGGTLKNFNNNNNLQVASEQRTWQGSLISTTYSNRGEVKVLLDTNKFYKFEGFMQVDAQADGFNFSNENSINFNAFVCIKDIRPVSVSPGALLLLLD